ncbi:response regulator [Patescibacteria group bacterium]|nr:response regulator [Patescibacteria group bacterium]MBU1075154.1 response regulator [Patescibacteria group bacterium]MBU1951377.1 response regulator [Patescibacteria group bacterium]MBU2229470.1 response regulator [Patescibacteria group bacterium]MBU2235670.1 response regulator [Patescibacteria group bacterium]
MSTKQKILLIEDDKMLLEMYTAKFTREGFDIKTAENGSDGLKAAREMKPDMVLLDIIMPKLDGFATLKEIRKDENIKDVPVILLTNLGQDQDIQKGKDLGADDYFVKANHTPTEIVEKVQELLKKKGVGK